MLHPCSAADSPAMKEVKKRLMATKVLSAEWVDLANELVEMRKAAMYPVTCPVTHSSASSDLPVLPVPRGIRVMEGMSQPVVNQTVEQEDDFDETPAAPSANDQQVPTGLPAESIGAAPAEEKTQLVGAMPDVNEQSAAVNIPRDHPPGFPTLTIGEQSAPVKSPGEAHTLVKIAAPIGVDQSAPVTNPGEQSAFIRSDRSDAHGCFVEQPDDGLERSIHRPLVPSNPLRTVLGEEKGCLMMITQAGDGSRNMGPAGDLTRPGEPNPEKLLIPMPADLIGEVVTGVLSAAMREAETQSVVTEMNPSLPHPTNFHIVTLCTYFSKY